METASQSRVSDPSNRSAPGAPSSRNTTAPDVPAIVRMGHFIRVSHTFFSLPLVIAGMAIAADGWPGPRIFLLALVAAAGARTAAMALNRIIDREIDARNARTARRELPAGGLSLAQAWGVAVAGVVLYLAAAAILSPFLLAISPIPLVVFVGYPYLKRWTPYCHFGVGLALGLSPLGGWLAVVQSWRGVEEILPLVLFGTLWVAGFDVTYATLDLEFDRAHGLRSIPESLGRDRALRISFLLHAVAFLGLLGLWRMQRWSPWSLVLLALVGGLLYTEHRLASVVESAFFRINIWVGFAVLAFAIAGIAL
jgi:4-hydroxybenzoate polyprenyltransferase